ncbi:hypothetical protein [Bacillus sp. FJAT-47783]
MTKKYNKGSVNQNRPDQPMEDFDTSGDNSKGNKRNKDERSKTN